MSKVEQRPVIGIVPTQVPDEDIVRVYGSDGLVEAIEVRDRTFMMGVQWHPEYFAGERSMGCIFKTLSMEASKALERSAFARMACISRGKMLAGDGRAFILPIAFNVLLTLAFKRLPSWEDVFCLKEKRWLIILTKPISIVG